jgi:hypothetical protein
MPPSTAKVAAPPKDKDRRKSGGKPTLLQTLRVSPINLRRIIDPSSIKEESPVKASPDTSTTLANEASAPVSNGDNGSESNPGTPAPSGTPSQGAMGPPSESLKKKGVKRAANGGDPMAKIRGKPGPKKKQRMDEGAGDSGARNTSTYHKLGPKANQGAINAGLRALDRSGAPCRKWARGGFKVKSFTGVTWEIPRWTAPHKPTPETSSQESPASADSSNKENKEGSQQKSETGNSNPGGEQQQSMPASIHASSPAPTPVAAAS